MSHAPPTAEQIQQAWDESWPTSCTTTGRPTPRRQVVDLLRRPLHHPTPRTASGLWPVKVTGLRQRAGARLWNRVLPAEPGSSAVCDEGHVTDLSPGMVEVAKRNGAHLGFDLEGRWRTRDAAVPLTSRSTWSSDTRSCTTSRTRAGDARRCCAYCRAGASCSPHFSRLTARKLSQLTWAPQGASPNLPGLRDSNALTGRGRADESSRRRPSRWWWTSTPSTRSNCGNVREGRCGEVGDRGAHRPGWVARTHGGGCGEAGIPWLRVFSISPWHVDGPVRARTPRPRTRWGAQYFHNVSVTGIRA